MRTEADLIKNIKKLTPGELRTLNRYYLHPKDQRACNKCHVIHQGVKDNFHIKKYYPNGAVGYNVACKFCKNSWNRAHTKELRKDLKRMIHKRFIEIKSRALKEQISFNLTEEYLIDLYTQQEGKCFYTQVEMSFENVTSNSKSAHPLQPSLDKKDPKLGYTVGNVSWVCHLINIMKHDCNHEEFLEICEVIHKNHGNPLNES